VIRQQYRIGATVNRTMEVKLLDLCNLMLCVSSLTWVGCSSKISKRLRENDGIKRSEWLHKQPSNFAQYWKLSHERHWSRAPLVLASIALAGALVSAIGSAVLLLARVGK
jgi:hypothetical protein